MLTPKQISPGDWTRALEIFQLPLGDETDFNELHRKLKTESKIAAKNYHKVLQHDRPYVSRTMEEDLLPLFARWQWMQIASHVTKQYKDYASEYYREADNTLWASLEYRHFDRFARGVTTRQIWRRATPSEAVLSGFKYNGLLLEDQQDVGISLLETTKLNAIEIVSLAKSI